MVHDLFPYHVEGNWLHRGTYVVRPVKLENGKTVWWTEELGRVHFGSREAAYAALDEKFPDLHAAERLQLGAE